MRLWNYNGISQEELGKMIREIISGNAFRENREITWRENEVWEIGKNLGKSQKIGKLGKKSGKSHKIGKLGKNDNFPRREKLGKSHKIWETLGKSWETKIFPGMGKNQGIPEKLGKHRKNLGKLTISLDGKN